MEERRTMNCKPFFYKIVAAELMSEVLQIPDGKHKEWLTQFVLDLVAAKGSTEYTKKVINEVKQYREKQAKSGSLGGKKSSKKKVSDPKATLNLPLSDTEESPRVALGSNNNRTTKLHPIQGQSNYLLLDDDCPF
jgi:hypothetical protein